MKGSKRESVFQTDHVDGTYYWLISVFNKDLKKKRCNMQILATWQVNFQNKLGAAHQQSNCYLPLAS